MFPRMVGSCSTMVHGLEILGEGRVATNKTSMTKNKNKMMTRKGYLRIVYIWLLNIYKNILLYTHYHLWLQLLLFLIGLQHRDDVFYGHCDRGCGFFRLD